MSLDKRQKLSELDYQKIKFNILINNNTIRETANTFGCSTKYVHRLITQTSESVSTFSCSGCGYQFTGIDLATHHAVYTSGFTKPLSCASIAP
jgi:5-methylcytosine-specific restriction endonuclease McrA